MNTEQAKKLSEDALNRLIAELERGHSETLKLYLATMSRFRKYSWQNSLMIHCQLPTATHVGGYHFWLKMGRHVRKGEKGIAILAPMVGAEAFDGRCAGRRRIDPALRLQGLSRVGRYPDRWRGASGICDGEG